VVELWEDLDDLTTQVVLLLEAGALNGDSMLRWKRCCGDGEDNMKNVKRRVQ
jgi:hypothetical protein